MPRRRILLLSAAAVMALPGSVRAQAPHWLIGTWRGPIVGLQEGNNNRTLRITSVAADGTVEAQWDRTSVPATFRANELSLTTGASNPVVLTRSAENTLSGYFTAQRGAGRRYSVVLQRQ